MQFHHEISRGCACVLHCRTNNTGDKIGQYQTICLQFDFQCDLRIKRGHLFTKFDVFHAKGSQDIDSTIYCVPSLEWIDPPPLN
jgi:hypothetical protein